MNVTRKYIVGYEVKNNKIIIMNNVGETKEVDNNIKNKVKVMEVIKEHKKEILKKIDKYNNKREDYLIIIFSCLIFLLFLGCVSLFSFFVGSYIFLLLCSLSFIISLIVFGMNLYKILLFRKEIKELKYVIENKNVINTNELKELLIDGFKYIKNCIYNILVKVITLFEHIKVKFN